jgi:uncharacterized protein YndB with AHSA1/START domain
MAEAIRTDYLSKHPPQKVWAALTSSEAMSRWLMPNDFQPVLGHRFTFRRPPIPQINYDGITHCEVIELEAEKVLAFTFKGGPLDTLVRFRLQAEGAGTRVFLEHSGFDVADPKQRFAFDNMSGGWAKLGSAIDQWAEQLG